MYLAKKRISPKFLIISLSAVILLCGLFQNCATPSGETGRQPSATDLSQPLATVLDCSFAVKNVPNGSSVVAYQLSSVASGETCSAENRICENGILSGSYPFSSCTVGPAQPCIFDGQSIVSGNNTLAFSSTSVPFGQSCASQLRVCENGVLTGTYAFASCNTESASSCDFLGQSVPNGQQILAYERSAVPYGQICSAQQRTCNAGILSGDYSYSSCYVASVNYGDTCQTNSNCGPNFTCISSLCKYKSGHNTICDDSQDCSEAGQICRLSSVSGYRCLYAGTLNSQCTILADCKYPYNCLSNGLCQSLRSKGASCSKDYDCQSNYCRNNTCL